MVGVLRVVAMRTAKYVVTRNEQGQFTGFCTQDAFERNPELYLDQDDTYEAFVGPEPDGTDENFEAVKRLALELCSHRD